MSKFYAQNDYVIKKFNALAFRDLDSRGLARFEVRTIRPQRSIQQWILQLELFEAIISYTGYFSNKFNSDLLYSNDPNHHLENFKALLEKLNLDPEKYKRLLNKSWLKQWSEMTHQTSANQCLKLFN